MSKMLSSEVHRPLRSPLLRPVYGAVRGCVLDTLDNLHSAYSMRRLRSNHAGPLVRIRRASDDAEQDFYWNAQYDLDTAMVSRFISGTTGHVVTWYDQGAEGLDLTQATASKQPDYNTAGMNNRPSLTFGGTGVVLSRTISSDSLLKDYEAGHHMNLVVKPIDATLGNDRIWMEGGAVFPIRYYIAQVSTVAAVQIANRDSDTSIVLNFDPPGLTSAETNIIDVSVASGVVSNWVDDVASSDNTLSYTPGDFTSALTISSIGAQVYGDGGNGEEFDGDIAEAYFLKAVQSAASRSAIAQNQISVWGE